MAVFSVFVGAVVWNMWAVADYSGMMQALSYFGTAGLGYGVHYLKSNGVPIGNWSV